MAMMKTIMLNPTQLKMAEKLGMSVTDYAKAVAKLDEHVTMTTFNPNKDPVYSIPLSVLVNLWRAKYGDTWVDVSVL